MDTRLWSRELITDLINMYKDYPCLWKVKCEQYKNRNLKEEAYQKMIALCRDRGFPDANRDLVVKKLQSLRGSFRKELKKSVQSQRSGSATEDIYKPCLWYYDLLLFTKDQEIPTDSVSNMDDPEMDPDPRRHAHDENLEGNEDDTPSVSAEINKPEVETSYNSATRSRKRKTDNAQAEFLSVCTATLQANRKPISEYDATGVTVAKKLERMDPIQAIYAESLINSILRRGLLKKLTEDSDFCAGNCKTTTGSPSPYLSSELSSLHTPVVLQDSSHSGSSQRQQQPSLLQSFHLHEENEDNELRTYYESQNYN